MKTNITYYQYDNHPNPFYLIKQRPGWVSAHSRSPNNVIKASGAATFEKVIDYHANGLPKGVLENGVYYTYQYK
jgi:hypothetical protein